MFVSSCAWSCLFCTLGCIERSAGMFAGWIADVLIPIWMGNCLNGGSRRSCGFSSVRKFRIFAGRRELENRLIEQCKNWTKFNEWNKTQNFQSNFETSHLTGHDTSVLTLNLPISWIDFLKYLYSSFKSASTETPIDLQFSPRVTKSLITSPRNICYLLNNSKKK